MQQGRSASPVVATRAPMSSVGVGTAPGIPQSLADGSLAEARALSPSAIGAAAVTLCVIAAMLVAGRIGWRLGMVVLIGCGALLGGGAILEGLQTAIAVSP